MILQDLTYAVRSFAGNRGFTSAAMLSLALGIGVNTAIFSVVSALLLQPLPYRDAGRLVILWNRSPGLNITQDWFSTAQYFDVKTGHHGFAQLAIAIGGNYNLTGDGDPERIGATRISSNLLPMLGGRASMGRLFLPEEDSPGPPATCVLSYGMWERRYGRDPRILGRSLTLNGQPYSIAGVLSRDFTLPREVLPTLYGTDQAEILLPLPLGPAASNQRNHEDYNIVGTLRPGVTVREAQAEMDTLTARLRHDYPDLYPPNSGLTFGIVPLLEQVVGEVRRPLLVLLGAVGFVLLIACANVANLLLARAVARQKEIAIRMALGAGRWRVTRQLLTESVLLAIAGGALGVLLAEWFVVGLRVVGTKSVPRLAEISIDWRVLAFTLLISLCSGILFGLAPALRGSRLDLNSTLKDAARGSAGGGHNMRALLVVSQLAIAAMLAIGAGLLIRSFYRLQQTPAGFNPAHVLTLELTMTGRKYDDRQAVLRGYRELWERLDRVSGVTASGAVSALPLSQMYSWGPITVEGRTPPPGEGFFNADQRIVAGRYFETMQIPLVRGRLFEERDTLDTRASGSSMSIWPASSGPARIQLANAFGWAA